jgi:3'(2'), 5'-bisphosphate nucleotidase
MDSTDERQFLEACKQLAREAGELILRHDPALAARKRKADGSEVSEADHAANAHIVQGLAALTPGLPIVAEESPLPAHAAWQHFWLVDPLDGTRAFLRGEPDYTVNIALVRAGKPVLGVIYQPAEGLLYWGTQGQAARARDAQGSEPINARTTPPEGLSIVKSRRAPSGRFMRFIEPVRCAALAMASSSIKFCHVAEGSADLYPRLGDTMEWDTAAGQAILEAAGGGVCMLDGAPLAYGKPGFANPHFIAYGRERPDALLGRAVE